MKRLHAILMCIITVELQLLAQGSLRVLIISNDDDNGFSLQVVLWSFPDFSTVNAIHWSNTPSASALSGYDAVVAAPHFNPLPNSSAWGDLVADFARDGGGVTCGFAYYSTGGWPTDYGRLALPENNPFTRGSNAVRISSLGTNLIPGHPLMTNVNTLTTYYACHIQPNSNAVLVAVFDDGLPVTGYKDVGAGRVVGIQVPYERNPYFVNEGDFMQLYRNAVVYSVAAPAPPPQILSVVPEGASVRIHWQGKGGSNYVIQAASNLLSTNSFGDIAPPILLPGSRLVATNHLDAGALTNHPARFYRIKRNG